MSTSKTKYQEPKILKFLWITYSFFIIYGTIIPFNLVPSKELVLSNYDKISWIPFIDPDGSRASIPDIVQNVLLFLPFGFLSFLSMNQRKWRRIFIATSCGSLLSILVEILQLIEILAISTFLCSRHFREQEQHTSLFQVNDLSTSR